jgi:hypothetical protein
VGNPPTLPDPVEVREEIEHIIYSEGGYLNISIESVIADAIHDTLAWVESVQCFDAEEWLDLIRAAREGLEKREP